MAIPLYLLHTPLSTITPAKGELLTVTDTKGITVKGTELYRYHHFTPSAFHFPKSSWGYRTPITHMENVNKQQIT